MSEFISSQRVVVFVPEADSKFYIETISPHIPSWLGPYDYVCWWSAAGTEQFRPLEGAHPATGEIGAVVQTPSVRIEIALPMDEAEIQTFIKDVLIRHHPWESPVLYRYATDLLKA